MSSNNKKIPKENSEEKKENSKNKKGFWLNFLKASVAFVLFGIIFGAVALYFILDKYGRDLPDYQQLTDYEPPIISRVYAADGSLIEEYSKQRRLFVPIKSIPKPLIYAFISAEDKNFYTHGGLDFIGLIRAVLTNLKNIGSNKRAVGASTITQQVAKNFLVGGAVKYERKIKEAIISYRIEKKFSKDKILELYMNEVYLGLSSYGVAAASLSYFSKSMDELSLGEAAYLAAVLKGPANYHPMRHKEKATSRRNWVLRRMFVNGYITENEMMQAQGSDLIPKISNKERQFTARYFTEDVRRELKTMYGDKDLYEGGLFVRTSLKPKLQTIAERELKSGLIAYDRRHGWRGALEKIIVNDQNKMQENVKEKEDWRQDFKLKKYNLGMKAWNVAVVTDVLDDMALIELQDGSPGKILLSELKWARKWLKKERLGKKIKKASDVLSPLDVIAVEFLKSKTDQKIARYSLRQIPEIDGSMIVMDPHTGRILAMVGGYDFNRSEYNRATQAKRQPGSAFKPFVYGAALEKGFTPSSLILDAPFVIDQGYGRGKWKPKNSSNYFYGLSTMRLGIEKSRNLMTVRLAQKIGMEAVSDMAYDMGISEDMPKILSMSLGAGETTLLKLTRAYAMIVNGGKEIKPTLIDRIQDRYGKTIFKHDKRECHGCLFDLSSEIDLFELEEPVIADERKQIMNGVTAYQLVSMMEGVVKRGTGRKIAVLRKPLAGKTGTTNDSIDTWFIGFSPDLVVGIFVGFDYPRSLGRGEEGSTTSTPVFRDFMRQYLKNQPSIPFRIPEGVALVRVNAKTGVLAEGGERGTILEAFKIDNMPTKEKQLLDANKKSLQKKKKLNVGTGGIY